MMQATTATTQRSFRLAGAVAAVIAGAVVIWATRTLDVVGPLAGLPLLVGLGLVTAALLGSALARVAVTTTGESAVLLGLGFGVLVPAAVGTVVALPFAPIAIYASTMVWPLTIPAGLVWVVLLRWPPSRRRLELPIVAAVAIGLSGALLAVRYTEPIWSAGAAGGRCVTFPGEQVVALEWSPDGEWLAIGSERDYVEGVIRVLRAADHELVDLARGEDIDARGLAVGPGGHVTFQEHGYGDLSEPPGRSSLWEAGPGMAAGRLANLPTPGLVDITWTPDGIGGLLVLEGPTGQVTREPVWIRTAFDPAALEPMPDAKAAEPAMATLTQLYAESLRVNVGGVPRDVPWPVDASGPIVVSEDGQRLLFQAWRLTDDGEATSFDHLVAQSIATGERAVLVEDRTSEARLAGNRLAYISSGTFSDNRLCLVELPPT